MTVQVRPARQPNSIAPKTIVIMKRFFPTLLLLPVLLTGCAHRYVITLNNGSRITTAGKPRLENGSYVFKDAKGQPASVFAGSVREVAPASMSKNENSQFIRSTAK